MSTMKIAVDKAGIWVDKIGETMITMMMTVVHIIETKTWARDLKMKKTIWIMTGDIRMEMAIGWVEMEIVWGMMKTIMNMTEDTEQVAAGEWMMMKIMMMAGAGQIEEMTIIVHEAHKVRGANRDQEDHKVSGIHKAQEMVHEVLSVHVVALVEWARKREKVNMIAATVWLQEEAGVMMKITIAEVLTTIVVLLQIDFLLLQTEVAEVLQEVQEAILVAGLLHAVQREELQVSLWPVAVLQKIKHRVVKKAVLQIKDQPDNPWKEKIESRLYFFFIEWIFKIFLWQSILRKPRKKWRKLCMKENVVHLKVGGVVKK
jgi:hypothetical protein